MIGSSKTAWELGFRSPDHPMTRSPDLSRGRAWTFDFLRDLLITAIRRRLGAAGDDEPHFGAVREPR